ncbi:MAG TPA: hypothetical protein PK737_01125 [Bacilli bacterium]|nr:hypothetical protein [Bacilli bacterium]
MSTKTSDFFTPQDFAKVEGLANTLAQMEAPLDKLNIYLAKTSRFMLNTLTEAAQRQGLIIFAEQLKAIMGFRRIEMLENFIASVKNETYPNFLATIELTDKCYIKNELKLIDEEMPEARELNPFEQQLRSILQQAIYQDLMTQYKKADFAIEPTVENINFKL